MRQALREFVHDAGLGPRLRDARVFRAWREAAGEALARRARAVRFQGGELCVEVSSSAHRSELEMTGEGLRRAANALLGEEKIRRITFQSRR
ncbi:MAG TPA: DciA family protein [Thermoanaerobaculia bacterium]|nr:DciA family protein [Thermoanaerobaculia bacterium]